MAKSITVDEAYNTTIDGLRDNARVNSVPLTDGWEGAQHAIDTYNPDLEPDDLTAEEWDALRHRIDAFLI